MAKNSSSKTSVSPTEGVLSMLMTKVVDGPNTSKSMTNSNKLHQAIDLLWDVKDKYPEVDRIIESLQNVLTKIDGKPKFEDTDDTSEGEDDEDSQTDDADGDDDDGRKEDQWGDTGLSKAMRKSHMSAV